MLAGLFPSVAQGGDASVPTTLPVGLLLPLYVAPEADPRGPPPPGAPSAPLPDEAACTLTVKLACSPAALGQLLLAAEGIEAGVDAGAIVLPRSPDVVFAPRPGDAALLSLALNAEAEDRAQAQAQEFQMQQQQMQEQQQMQQMGGVGASIRGPNSLSLRGGGSGSGESWRGGGSEDGPFAWCDVTGPPPPLLVLPPLDPWTDGFDVVWWRHTRRRMNDLGKHMMHSPAPARRSPLAVHRRSALPA